LHVCNFALLRHIPHGNRSHYFVLIIFFRTFFRTIFSTSFAHSMTIALLTIGDELCLGQITNTNATWLAQQCTAQGWRVLQHSVVGDDLALILAEFDRLLASADVLLITGGLGPTHDDRTKTALADYLGDALTLHEPTREHIEQLMKQRGRTVNERTATQAFMPSSCVPLQNDKGTAAGMWFEIPAPAKSTSPTKPTKRVIAAMPGVPHEMKHLFTDRIAPRLLDYARVNGLESPTILARTIVTTGIVETELAALIAPTDPELEAFLEGQELAFLPSAAGVRMRITVTEPSRAAAEKTLAHLEHKIRSRIERYVVAVNAGVEGDTLETILVTLARKLTERGATIAVAESCTGGLLGAALTSLAGSSAYFFGGIQCYSNEAKTRLLGVLPATIAAHGAVSEQTARELATNVRASFDATYGISITGIAGPGGGSADKPVGTVWIGIATAETCTTHHHTFGSDRAFNRERAVAAALRLVLEDMRA
jgi:nicotinamide-nucleotide amidase